ncbi:MAG: hypothetical protein M1548_08515 [Actinobacteria bacterium]|nr:hypothetical protein [Actinomycetota bacterium]
MNKSDFNRFCSYVRQIADLLHLKDWRIRIEVDEAEDFDGFMAVVHPIEGRKRARLILCKEWLELSPEDQRHSIVHELVHCHLAGAGDIVRLDLLKNMSQSSYDIFYGGFKRQIEYAVDGLADAVAPLLPLPR